MAITAKVTSGGRTIKARTVAAGSAGRLNQLSDVDVTLLDQGSILIWDNTNQKWIAKSDVADGTSLNGGSY
jgi:hypothetical protein